MSDSSTRSWYFVNKSARVLGPLDEVKLAGKLASKELTPHSLVWNGRLANKWTRLANVPGLLPRLRRKSRGLSQLDIVLRRVSELAVKKCADKFSFIVSYFSNSETESDIDIESSSDAESMAVTTEGTDELEEKCPILSPRPLVSLMSERSEGVSPVPSLPRLINSPSIDRNLLVCVTPTSDDGLLSTKIPLAPRSSEEPLCLGIEGLHFISQSYELMKSKDDFEHEVSSSVPLDDYQDRSDDDSDAVLERAVYDGSSSSLLSDSSYTSDSSSSSEMPPVWPFQSD